MHQVWIRIRRKPWFFAAIFLFAVVIAFALCALHHGNEAAQEEYENICAQVKIRCTVTNLTGNQSDQLTIYHGILGLFTGNFVNTPERIPAVFADFLEDVQVKGSTEIVVNGDSYTLTGITSVEVESRLRPENQCTIFWNEGVDETVFGTAEALCIIPRALEEKLVKAELPTDTLPITINTQSQYEQAYEGELPVTGVYAGKDETTIYCPWDAYVAILRSMNRYEKASSLYATLKNNEELELLRETAAEYLAVPDPNLAGKMTDEKGNYLALDINDSALVRARTNLENSMQVNTVASTLVFVLATVSGAFIGFLVVRSRKREIALMRTLGTSDLRIYGNFAAEQMIFVILGAVAGGVYFSWNPVNWLMLFMGVYFVGLSVAIVVMLRKNLLTSIKEND